MLTRAAGDCSGGPRQHKKARISIIQSHVCLKQLNVCHWCHIDVNTGDVAFTAKTIALFVTFHIYLPGAFSRTTKSQSLSHFISQALTWWRNYLLMEQRTWLTVFIPARRGSREPLSSHKQRGGKFWGFFCYQLPFLDIQGFILQRRRGNELHGATYSLKSSTDSALHFDLSMTTGL